MSVDGGIERAGQGNNECISQDSLELSSEGEKMEPGRGLVKSIEDRRNKQCGAFRDRSR